jgi:hypothetical protein
MVRPPVQSHLRLFIPRILGKNLESRQNPNRVRILIASKSWYYITLAMANLSTDILDLFNKLDDVDDDLDDKDGES